MTRRPGETPLVPNSGMVNGSLDISRQAIAHNARTLRDLVAPAKTAFVVKANGYGHGLLATARAVEPFAHAICVYSMDEAIALRDGGIASPVLVMGPIDAAALDEACAKNLEIALWDTGAYLRDVAAAARKRNTRAAVHVKINTGAARLGLETHDATDALEDYARIPEIGIAGIFSHLAAAEELDSPFTEMQIRRFETVLQGAEPVLHAKGARPLRHIAASAAAVLWPQTRMDMVRIGIALYGLWPSEQTRLAMNGAALDLIAALSYTTRLAAVRTVEAGTPIGYGCSYHAPKRTRIGILPMGYADGIPRLLSNRGSFIVNGARCPIVGRVCMNMTMIDLERAPKAQTGDTVTLIGSDGDARVGADDWAAWAETINYEIVARLPAHVQRCWQ
jgi:alanine racemase